ncbi:biosynthetic-type acetolactate synthase large subunit [Oribacterium sp. oral taxon 108]|uniref:biosynthetic-type acetolactate synthase large subunit n=1 Tax=Oribacterium sp. oral taxon 108 TaxID=712414 RepID=UPI00020DD904|nr:biosynthetic-type acetolactate synthase large subunit [Oribacterium sp. oral taxon 108]EGL38320.1 acetolactate synthase, large subunit, biosynthetic type [Oribacterium sp. oral taxon 108 str. F0425]
MKLKGARILIEELIRQGVDTVFGYPGGAVLNIYDELYQCRDRIHHVLTAHEQGAAHAADGYARASGKVGVVIATSGPGATNLVTGIANAYLDSVPLVAITGNVATEALGRDSFQEVDIVSITQPVVKHNFMVKDVSELEQTIKEAFLIANSGRKGPVLIDIPKDVQVNECEYGVAVLPKMPEKAELPYDEEGVIKLLNSAKKPFIYAGGGIIACGGEDCLRAFAEKLNAPVAVSMMGRTAFPDSHPLSLGLVGMHGSYQAAKVQSECDLMLAVGVRFSDRATGNLSAYTKNCKIIHVDIDKAELGKNLPPDFSVQADVKKWMKSVLPKLKERKNTEWWKEIESYKKVTSLEKDAFHPKNILETVRRFTKDETVVATDVGQHQMWTAQYYRFEKPGTFLTSGGLGTMGYGLGAAIGACLAKKKEETVLITSDGSFSMNCNELCTTVKEGLPITIVLLNNQVLGMVRQWQTAFFGERYSATILDRGTDFVKLIEAYGGKGFSIHKLSELEKALEERKNIAGPVLLDCHIDKDEKVLPMIPPGKSVAEIIL